MSETRVIGAQGPKIGGGRRPSTPPATPAPPSAPAAPPRRRGRIIVLMLVVAAVAAGVVFYLMRPTDTVAAPEEPEPEPGITMLVDPRNINLADGHYLRLGFAIELVADAEEVPVPVATDIAIALFSGRTVEEVNDPERRAALKEELTAQLTEAYEGQVYAVHLTDFVTQ